jgi:hypothetical protein
VGLYYKKHEALSEGAKRFIGICQRAFSPMASVLAEPSEA